MMEQVDTEDRILEAALHAFASKGKHGARTQEIADAAGINKAMLHYYFRSKDRLYDAVFLYVFRRLMASFGHAIGETTTFSDTLRTFIDGYIGFISQNLDVVRFLVNENLAGGQVMGEHLSRLLQDAAPTLPRIILGKIQAAIDAGEIRDVDPMQTLLTLLSACVFPFVLTPTVARLTEARGTAPADFFAARREHLFDVFYNGLKVSPA